MMEVPNTDHNIRSVCDLTADEVSIGNSRGDSNSADAETNQWQCDDSEADVGFYPTCLCAPHVVFLRAVG